MEERSKELVPQEEGVEEAGQTQEPQEGKEEWVDQAKRSADRRRSYILWVLGGAYLVYTCYGLVRGYMAGDEEMNLILMLIGIAFGLIGAFLVFVGVRGMMKLQEAKEQEAKEAKPAAPEGEESAPQEKKLSIAERAALAKKLGDVEEEETNG